MEVIKKDKILTVPNALSAFRLVLAAVFAVVYCAFESEESHWASIGILVLSGITDMLDGKIARKFNMISELGKVLDPLGDKVTQAVLACCLATKYDPMKLLFLVLFVKEITQLCYGAYAVKKAGRNDGAKWCGKITTVYLYVMMGLLLLIPNVPVPVYYTMIFLGIGLLIWSMISYLLTFRSMVKEAK